MDSFLRVKMAFCCCFFHVFWPGVTLSPLTVSSFLRALMGYGLSGACRDVSSVEVLMNYHQSLKSEVEARNKSVLQCIEMGKTLLAARNPASEEVTHKTIVML